MKVLIVEDEPQTIEAVSLIFKLKWPEVELLSTTYGSEAAPMVEEESPDVVIIDLGLPDVDGMEVLKEIRGFSDVPIIIVTGRGDPISHIKGLELGANDYITKPFDPGVLMVRTKKVLAGTRVTIEQTSEPLAVGSIVFDFANRQVSFQGKRLTLTPKEYELLCYLVRNAERVLSHDSIIRAVWGEGYETTDVLRTCIYQLRQKLTQAGANPEIISLERGIGYRFVILY